MQNRLKKLPWKSKIFSWGVAMIVLGVLGFFLHGFDTYPSLDDLDVYKGKVQEVENWRVKNVSGVDVFVKIGNDIKRFNFGECRSSLNKINIGNEIIIHVKKANSISRVDGGIWQLEKNGKVLCNYRKILSIEKKSDQNSLYFSCLSLIVGMFLVLYGFIKSTKNK